jgi:hypothetical protein
MKFNGNSTSGSRVRHYGNTHDDASRYLLFEAPERSYLFL